MKPIRLALFALAAFFVLLPVLTIAGIFAAFVLAAVSGTLISAFFREQLQVHAAMLPKILRDIRCLFLRFRRQCSVILVFHIKFPFRPPGHSPALSAPPGASVPVLPKYVYRMDTFSG